MKPLITLIAAPLLLNACCSLQTPTAAPLQWVGQDTLVEAVTVEPMRTAHADLEPAKQLQWGKEGLLTRSTIRCQGNLYLGRCSQCIHVLRNPRNEGQECGILLACCDSKGGCQGAEALFGPGDEIGSFVCGPEHPNILMSCDRTDETCALSFLDF